MPTATLRWTGGKQFIGTDSHNQSVILSASDEAGGVRPSQLLLIALCGCSSVEVVEILQKKRMGLQSLEVTASGEQEPDPPWPYRQIHLQFRLKGTALNDRAVEQAIKLAEDKYCSVAATLRGRAKITTGFEILA